MSGSSSPQGGSRRDLSGSSSPQGGSRRDPSSPRGGTEALRRREAAALLPTYRRRPVAFVRGEGVWLTDAEGREYLDFLCGLSVTGLGHAHPAVTEAVAQQMARLTHVSNLFYTEPQVHLAERLKALLGWPDAKAFLCNSGAEANEGAIKLARRHGKRQDPAKHRVVALEGSFHGRTLAALLATGNPAKHEPFEPLGSWVTHVAHDEPAALDAAVDERTCAVLVEVVQGEGGVRPVPAAVLEAARRACDRVDALLVVDEVQTGVGRLGSWFGYQSAGGGADLEPDVVCLAKALANGLPIGAILARGPAAEAFAPCDHGSTFGGGPVVAAAALAVLDVVDREGLVEQAALHGKRLRQALDRLVGRHTLASGVRGRGLLQALTLAAPVAGAVTGAALDVGLVVNDVAPDAVRIAPPLIASAADIDEGVGRLERALRTVA
jgi:acetylornithine/N-succinyldiaminopimelate aminotransferase